MFSYERRGSRALALRASAEGEQRDSGRTRLQCWKEQSK